MTNREAGQNLIKEAEEYFFFSKDPRKTGNFHEHG